MRRFQSTGLTIEVTEDVHTHELATAVAWSTQVAGTAITRYQCLA